MAAGQRKRIKQATCVLLETISGSPITSSKRNRKIGGIKVTNIRNVIIPFKTYVKFRSLIKEFLSLTSAFDALMIMMMGDSKNMAIE
jgi:hypothetical protein